MICVFSIRILQSVQNSALAVNAPLPLAFSRDRNINIAFTWAYRRSAHGHAGTSRPAGKRRCPNGCARAAAPSRTRAARGRDGRTDRRIRAVQTPAGSKPHAVLKGREGEEVSPVPPAGFLGPLGVAVTKETGRKTSVMGIAENVSLLV